MALTEKLPPDTAKRVFLDGLGADDSLQLQFSLPVYTLTLTDLTSYADPLTPRAAGWQFLTVDAQGAVVGEVPNEPDPGDNEITTSLIRGVAIDDALTATRAIRVDPAVRNEPFELRRLRISGLRIEALWVKALPADDVLGANDLIYSFAAFQAELTNKLLKAPAFLDIVRKLAATEIGLHNAPPR